MSCTDGVAVRPDGVGSPNLSALGLHGVTRIAISPKGDRIAFRHPSNHVQKKTAETAKIAELDISSACLASSAVPS